MLHSKTFGHFLLADDVSVLILVLINFKTFYLGCFMMVANSIVSWKSRQSTFRLQDYKTTRHRDVLLCILMGEICRVGKSSFEVEMNNKNCTKSI